jgi:phage shock protein PspC (stress-responsive transcriptional regulator)
MSNDTTYRISRSRSNRMIAGVCGGLADYLRIDATLVRLFFVLLALGEGIGILLYLILWLIMPEEEATDRRVDATIRRGAGEMGRQVIDVGNDVRRAVTRPNRQTVVLIGVVLITLGAFYLVDNLDIPGLQWFDVDLLWPLLLILGGVTLLVRQKR